MQCRDYTILYAYNTPYIYKNVRRYRTMLHTILILLTWGGVRSGSRWPCPWSAHRSCLMILGHHWWSVLHHHCPDALSLSMAYYTATNVSGDSLVRAKIGISSCDPVALRVILWHRWAKRLSGRVNGLPATQVACGPVAPPVGEPGEWLLVVDIPQGPVS